MKLKVRWTHDNYIKEDADGTEGDGIWQPGDGWVDDGDGVLDLGNFATPQDTYELPDENNYNDVWPPYNGIWDEGELVINDYGQDGLADTGDFGEGDGHLIPWDSGENDGVFDIGDGLYAFMGEPFSDENENGIYDAGEIATQILTIVNEGGSDLEWTLNNSRNSGNMYQIEVQPPSSEI